MDAPASTSLLAALRSVPDPRRARGRRHAWPLVLTALAAALLSGQRSVRASGRWADERREELVALLQPPGGRLPSASTLRRALRAVDVAALERQHPQAGPRRFGRGLPRPAPATPWAGQAVAGKAVRGAAAHGAPVHLVSRVRHGDGVALGQVRVAAKSNEIAAVPRLLAGQDLAGAGITMDAPLARRGPAAQIRRQRGHWAIENRVHDGRDVAFGEDAGQQRAGNTPQALAALRHGLLALVRGRGWASVADALRHHGADAPRALRALGALPPRL